MGYGNHLYLWEDSAFHKPHYADQVARTGWSWGAVDIDFDNDGDKDIYVGNGHISGASSRDYCSVFWRHDIYTGDSNPNPILEQFFKAEQASFQSSGSWNGYEHNCLLMNTKDGFIEVGFLFGLAHEFDTRNIVADDIDGNGLMDLLVVEHPLGQPANLRVWKNYGRVGNWIGVAVSEQSGNVIPGTRIVVRTESQNHVACVISGDSFNSQHAATEHFGLGDVTEVESIEVTYGDGTLQRLNDVETGMYHVVP